jgi:hypothetical protein
VAVTVERANLIVRKEASQRRFPGSLERTRKLRNFAEDDHLVRLAFATEDDARILLTEFESQGFRDDELALVSAADPYVAPVWLEVGLVEGTLCCWLRDEEPGAIAR